MKQLNNSERIFAEENHSIVYKYLCENKLDINEYYDVVIFRYIQAVQSYLSDPDLRVYKFSVIAFRAMASALNNHFVAERKRKEICPIVSSDHIYSVIGIEQYETDNSNSAALLWMQISAYLDATELDIVTRKADGATYREIGDDHGLSAAAVCNRMARIRHRIIKKFALMEEI